MEDPLREQVQQITFMAKEKPSGAEWEKWKAKEEAHWAKHNKGSKLTRFEQW